jgi:FAD/FMN-containing dehydrogenase
MTEQITGGAFHMGESEYESARRATVWNAATPDRYPDLVVQAQDPDDVHAAVRLARREGMQIGVRSGGHSWAGNHVRDGGLLLDVSALDDVEIDAEAMTATVGPGVLGHELLEMLTAHDLFFPAGHCPGVALGGYLLQGGFGWNGRVHGPACMSVAAIDAVTAEGELVHASEDENADLLWAARGAGPGFFAAVTHFHLRLQPLPAAIANGVYLYPGELLEEVFTWAASIGPDVAREMELMLIVHRDEQGEIEVAVTGPVLASTEEEKARALAILGTCPVRDRAKLAVPDAPVALADLYAGVHASYPDGHRYDVDNMWTHAPVEELLPGIRRIAETMPAAPSHMLWMNWDPAGGPARPEMAFSVEDETYIALYAVWPDDAGEAIDDANSQWATPRMREMEERATGIQLADENLGRRPARFAGDAQMARLDELRAVWDPDGRFHPWMGRL